jgi:hypothetical protein
MVSANAVNIALKLMLILARPLRFASTECGNKSGAATVLRSTRYGTSPKVLRNLRVIAIHAP